MDHSPPGSSVHGFPQARIPEWVAILYSRGSSQTWIESMSLSLLHWEVGSLPLEPPGKPLGNLLKLIKSQSSSAEQQKGCLNLAWGEMNTGKSLSPTLPWNWHPNSSLLIVIFPPFLIVNLFRRGIWSMNSVQHLKHERTDLLSRRKHRFIDEFRFTQTCHLKIF